MKKSKPTGWNDLLFLMGVGFFFFSCIATTSHLARTLDPGQGELVAGYIQGRNLESLSSDPVQLIGLNGRIGVVDNLDVGVEHVFDVSKENDNDFASLWGDLKWQLTNKENVEKKLTMATGLLKGYMYDQDTKIHATALPLYFSVPVTDRFTPFFNYRYELISNDFLPNSESFNNPRHSINLGLEYCLGKPDSKKWIPKFDVGIGYLNSLTGGEGADVLLLNFGFKLTSPSKH